jgi:PASTA domain/Glucodextranase, domain B
MRRPILVLATLLPVVLLAGCGDGSDPATPLRSVRLSVAEPGDAELVRDDRVAVVGRVDPPGATVTVRGERAPVEDGEFRAEVSLDPGTNIVDVLASAAGRRPAMTAVRVRRQVTVTVPELAGQTPEDAADRLTALGLDVEQDQRGGVIDLLLPGEPAVCETDPKAGEDVDAGTTVTLIVAKDC